MTTTTKRNSVLILTTIAASLTFSSTSYASDSMFGSEDEITPVNDFFGIEATSVKQVTGGIKGQNTGGTEIITVKVDPLEHSDSTYSLFIQGFEWKLTKDCAKFQLSVKPYKSQRAIAEQTVARFTYSNSGAYTALVSNYKSLQSQADSMTANLTTNINNYNKLIQTAESIEATARSWHTNGCTPWLEKCKTLPATYERLVKKAKLDEASTLDATYTSSRPLIPELHQRFKNFRGDSTELQQYYRSGINRVTDAAINNTYKPRKASEESTRTRVNTDRMWGIQPSTPGAPITLDEVKRRLNTLSREQSALAKWERYIPSNPNHSQYFTNTLNSVCKMHE